MTTPAYTEALERALGQVIARAKGEVETIKAQADALMATAQARVAKAETRLQGLDRQIADRLSTLKDGAPGRDGQDGASVSLEDVRPVIDRAITEAVALIPAPAPGRDGQDGVDGKDGRSVTIEEVEPLVGRAVADAVALIPVPENGKDGLDGRDGQDGERGPEGPPGKLPVARAWTDTVHYEGDCCTFEGGLFQALRDTGRAPPHEDWILLAAKGEQGEAGRDAAEHDYRGTYDPEGTYQRLNVVALNGASFVARVDGAGPCPGPDWQLVAAQGKRGQPGERGERGEQGPAGPGVMALEIDGEGMLTLVNSDGSLVACDLYPVLSKIAVQGG